MVAEELEAELRKRPFLPFRVVTSMDKSYEITERNWPMIRVGFRSMYFGFLVPEDHPNFDRYEVVSLQHIVRLEPMPLQLATGG